MYTYEVELIHEGNGVSFTTIIDLPEPVSEEELANILWSEMSVVVLAEYEGDEND